MGSFLQNVGRAVKKGVVDTGHAIGDAQNNKWVKGAEALGLAATGIGAPEAALLMGGAGAIGGAIRHGGGLKGALTEGAQGALTGAAAGVGGKLLRAVGSKLLPSGQPSTGGGMVDANGNPTDPTLPPDGPVNADPSQSIGDKLLSVGKGAVTGLIPKNKDGSIDYGALLKAGVGAGTAYEGYKANQQANDLRNKALDAVSQQYNANAPLRAQATTGLQNTQRPDLSSIFDDQNPYKKRSLTTVGSRSPVGGY